MKIPVVLALALFLALPARADQVTLSNGDAMELLAGLRTLGGLHDQIIKEGGAERAVQVPYKLKAPVVDIVSSDLVVLRARAEAIEMTRLNLRQQVQALPEGKERDAASEKANDDLQRLMRETAQLDLGMLDRRDLGREEQVGNQISGITMSQIAPILKPVEEKK